MDYILIPVIRHTHILEFHIKLIPGIEFVYIYQYSINIIPQ